MARFREDLLLDCDAWRGTRLEMRSEGGDVAAVEDGIVHPVYKKDVRAARHNALLVPKDSRPHHCVFPFRVDAHKVAVRVEEVRDDVLPARRVELEGVAEPATECVDVAHGRGAVERDRAHAPLPQRARNVRHRNHRDPEGAGDDVEHYIAPRSLLDDGGGEAFALALGVARMCHLKDRRQNGERLELAVQLLVEPGVPSQLSGRHAEAAPHHDELRPRRGSGSGSGGCSGGSGRSAIDSDRRGRGRGAA